jgi:hypothetical protein
MEPRFYLLLTITSIAVAIVITYYVTLTRIVSKEHEAKIDATREKAVREARETMLSNLRTEQND